MAFGANTNLSVIITAIDKASGTLSKVGNNFAKTGAKMKSIGKSMTMGLTLPIAAVGVAATKMGLDFSKGIEYANTMLKLQGDELAKFKSGILDLSDKYGKSADDIARAAYSVSSVLHTTGKETITILDAITQASKAGKITTEAAGNAVIRMMSIYEVEAEDTMKMVDTLSATVKAGNANWQDMASILPTVSGLAKPLGISLEEVAAAFAATSAKAGSSAEAGTALRGVFTGLMKPSEEMKKAIKELGYDNAQLALKSIGLKGVLAGLGKEYGGNAEAIGKLFPNIRGITGAVALFANEGKDLAESMDMVYDSVGETQAQIEAGQGSAENFADAMNRLRNAGIRLFTTIEPYLSKIVKSLSNLAKKFSDLSPATKKIIVIVAGLVAALGPLLMILGSISMALPLLGPMFAGLTISIAATVAAVIAVIGLLIGVFVYAWKHWSEICEGWKIVTEALGDKIYNIFTSIGDFFVRIWEGIKGIFFGALEFIKKIFLNWTVPGLIIGHWKGIKDFFIGFWEAVVSIFTNIGNFLKGVLIVWKEILRPIWQPIVDASKALITFFTDWFKKIGDFIYEKWTGVKDKTREIWESISNTIKEKVEIINSFLTEKFNAIGDFIYSIWEKIKNFFAPVFNTISGIFTGFTNGIKNIWETVWNAIVGKIEWALDKIKGVVDKIKSAVSSAGDAVKNVGSKVSDFGKNVGGKVADVGRSIGGGVSSFWNRAKSGVSSLIGIGAGTEHYAEGGIVPGIGPRLATVHGGEMIIPKAETAEIVHGLEATSIVHKKGIGDINVYIQGGNYLDREAGEKFAEILGKMLRRELRY